MTARASLSRRWEPLLPNLIRCARSTRAADLGALRTAWATTLRHFRRRGYFPAGMQITPCRGHLTVRGRSRTCRGRGVPGTTRAALSRALSQYYLAQNLVAAPRRRRLRRALPCGQPSSLLMYRMRYISHSRTLCPCVSSYPSTERETKLMLRRRDSPAGSRSNHGSWHRDTWPGPLRSGPRIRALLDVRTSRLGCPRRS